MPWWPPAWSVLSFTSVQEAISLSLSHLLSYRTNGMAHHHFHFQKCLGAARSQGGEWMSAIASHRFLLWQKVLC